MKLEHFAYDVERKISEQETEIKQLKTITQQMAINIRALQHDLSDLVDLVKVVRNEAIYGGKS